MTKIKKIQKLNFQNLIQVSALLKNIKHFIFYGTLLGLIREKNIIPGDDDIDIMVNIKDKNKVLKIMMQNKTFKFNKKVSNKYFAQFIKKKNNISSFIDFYFFTQNFKKNFIIERHNWLAHINDGNFALHFPNNMIFPIRKHKEFKSLSIPNKPKSLLKFLYGKSWRLPLKKNTEYRVEIKNNKPIIIKRSFIGSITRLIKAEINKTYKKT